MTKQLWLKCDHCKDPANKQIIVVIIVVYFVQVGNRGTWNGTDNKEKEKLNTICFSIICNQ